MTGFYKAVFHRWSHPKTSRDTLRWWESNWWLLAASVSAAVPLIGPSLPPLVDLPGHIGRYRIVAEAGIAPLGGHYAVHRGLIGNLGVDLLTAAVHPLLDVEPAAHVICALIPVLTVCALLWLAREAHGKTSPAAMFALPLAYALPFQLGFVNFTASAALAIAGLALWIHLANRWSAQARIALFIPFAGLVWLCHSFGWAMFGLATFGAEWTIQRRRGLSVTASLARAALICAPFAWPQILSMIFSPPLVGDTGDWFDFASKAQWLASMLRERWKAYDVACVTILAMLLWAAIRSRQLAFDAIVGVPALLYLGAFLLLPRLYAGGAGVDMRLLPYATALGIVAIRTRGDDRSDLNERLALAGSAFFVLRLITSTAAFALFARDQAAELRALPFMPVGTSVLTVVREPISSDWQNRRLAHIAGIAIARRRVFTNEQWAIGGQQLIEPKHSGAAPYDRDPSQLIKPERSTSQQDNFDRAIKSFNRSEFQYVWTIGFAAGRARASDVTLVWSNDRSALYRVIDRSPFKAKVR